MIEVIICDDHAIVREGLKHLIEEYKDFHVIADVSSGEELFEELRTHQPDIIILDIALPGRSGLDVLKQLKALYDPIQVLVLSMYPEDQFAIRMIKAGASGYLHKDSPPEILYKAIQTIARGEKYISAQISSLLFKEIAAKPKKTQPHETLSDREYEVLLLIGEGKKVTEIADILSLSIKTISTHKTRIMKKLEVKNDSELIQYILANKLTRPSKELGDFT